MELALGTGKAWLAHRVLGDGREDAKRVFRRARPINGGDPNDFFECNSNCSFPSGEAAEAASIVTPYILEYGRDYPAVYLLSIIPLYVGIGRVKAQAHWQSDVVAGWAVALAPTKTPGTPAPL